MARLPRIKVENTACWYHLYAKAAGDLNHGVFEDKTVANKLLEILKHYSGIFYCQIGAFTILDNHYQLVIHFNKIRNVSKKVLLEKAKQLYPHRIESLDRWKDEDWEKFHKRLFNITEFMRSVQMTLPRWYNDNYKRKGTFWSERFKSTILTDERVVLDCMLYVDACAFREGKENKPEKWFESSIALRERESASWLMDLDGQFRLPKKTKPALDKYLEKLYYRCKVGNTSKVKVSASTQDEEMKLGLEKGVLLGNLRFFNDGLVVGTKKEMEKWVDKMREDGRYIRRINPIYHDECDLYSLREQRSNYVD